VFTSKTKETDLVGKDIIQLVLCRFMYIARKKLSKREKQYLDSLDGLRA